MTTQNKQRMLIVTAVVVFFLGAWIWYRGQSPVDEISAPASVDIESAPEDEDLPSEIDSALAEQEMLESGGAASGDVDAPTYEEKKMEAPPKGKPSSSVTLPPMVTSNPFKSSPNRDVYKEQASKDPHGTPAVLTAFAAEMADVMKAAKTNQKDGADAFTKLIQCARMSPDKEILTVRAICGENAATLAQLYPDALMEEYKAAYKEFPDGLRAMLRWNPL